MNYLDKEVWISIYKNVESVVTLFPCNNDDKPDLVHDALLHVYKRLKTNYIEKGKFDLWVKKVTLNYCKDLVTSNIKRNTSYYEELLQAQNMPYIYDCENIKNKMAIELIDEAILELKRTDQEIIIGRLNNESYTSLANRFNKNKKTIIKHCNQAFLRLRKIINKKFYDKYGTNYKDDKYDLTDE